VLSTLVVLFMLFDGVMKLSMHPKVVTATTQIGFAENTIRPIGACAAVGALLYAFPATAVLGAIVLTGFFGGAICTHVYLRDNQWPFALVFGVVTWLGIYLRDARLRSLIPLRRKH
jgi:hypothetical protein